MKKKGNTFKNLFVGDIEIPTRYTPGILKTHEYTSYRVAPTTDNDNAHIDSLIKSFHGTLNRQMMKNIRGGQTVVSLELYGNSTQSFYMYTVPVKYKGMIKERIQSAFKGGGVQEYSHAGWPFVDDTKNTLAAELKLSKEPFFPISMEKDAMICKDILHVTEQLKENEEVFIQILLEPAEDGWQDELERAYEDYLAGNSRGHSGGLFKSGGKKIDDLITRLSESLGESSPTESNRKHRQIKEFGHKRNQQGFHVTVRLLANAPTYEKRNDLIEGLASGFRTSSSHNHWTLSPVFRKGHTLDAVKNRKPGLLGQPNLFCDEEVKTLLRFPTKEIETFKLERMTPNEKTIDDRVTDRIIEMGTSVAFRESGKKVGFSITDDDTSCKSRLVIAPPGSGKSKLIQIFKDGACEHGHGGSVFDVADGQLYYECIESTRPEHRDKLVLVNYTNQEYPHIFNFDSLGRDADTIGDMFAEFFQVFYKTAANYRMNSFTRKAAMTAFSQPDATFLELIKSMRDEDYRKQVLPILRKENPELFLWWKTEFPKIVKTDSQASEILQPILYRLDELQMNKRLGPIFCGRGGKLDILKWMNDGRWVLYNLSNGVFLEHEQRILMSFLNYAYWIATLSRESMLQRKDRPTPHHKMYDEPQTYMSATPIFELSISKSRKYRVSDNFFIQNPSQVADKNPALWKQIIGMKPHIMIGGGLDDDSMKLMTKEFNITWDELKQLESLERHWYFKTYVQKQALPPFIFRAKDFVQNFGRQDELIEKWRQHFAPLHIDEVQRDKEARNLNLSVEEYEKLLESYDDETEEGVPLG
jgi:hypothetical protein